MIRRPQYRMSEVAAQLHSIIKESPGIHFRSLGREAHLSSVGQLRHHLDSLRRQGAIVELEDGRFKRYFASGEHEPKIRRGLARFSRPIPKRIGMLLLTRPMNRTEIRRNLGCADSTLGYHLNRMVELGDLKRDRGRNCCHYSLTDPDFIRNLLQFQCGSPPKRERKHWSDQDHTGVLDQPGLGPTRPLESNGLHNGQHNGQSSEVPVHEGSEPASANAVAAQASTGEPAPGNPAQADQEDPDLNGSKKQQQPRENAAPENSDERRPGDPEHTTSRPRAGTEVPAWLRHW